MPAAYRQFLQLIAKFFHLVFEDVAGPDTDHPHPGCEHTSLTIGGAGRRRASVAWREASNFSWELPIRDIERPRPPGL